MVYFEGKDHRANVGASKYQIDKNGEIYRLMCVEILLNGYRNELKCNKARSDSDIY